MSQPYHLAGYGSMAERPIGLGLMHYSVKFSDRAHSHSHAGDLVGFLVGFCIGS
jgi:hypothetical protein